LRNGRCVKLLLLGGKENGKVKMGGKKLMADPAGRQRDRGGKSEEGRKRFARGFVSSVLKGRRVRHLEGGRGKDGKYMGVLTVR